jgi:hypothetical protein
LAVPWQFEPLPLHLASKMGWMSSAKLTALPPMPLPALPASGDPASELESSPHASASPLATNKPATQTPNLDMITSLAVWL